MKFFQKNLHDTIKQFICDGWYFNSIFDEYYVPGRVFFQEQHYQHDFLLYGFNELDKNYSILGYDDNRKFEKTKISYKNFSKAFKSDNFYPDYYETHSVFLLKKRDKFYCDFNIKYVYDMLCDYYYGINTIERTGSYDLDVGCDKFFGLNVYNQLKKYFVLLVQNDGYSDIRSLHTLWEHKKFMLLRLKYMNQNDIIGKFDYFYNTYSGIANIILSLRNLQMKYGLTKDKKMIEEIIYSLDRIKQTESKILEELIELLQSRDEIKNA